MNIIRNQRKSIKCAIKNIADSMIQFSVQILIKNDHKNTDNSYGFRTAFKTVESLTNQTSKVN